MPVPPVLSPAVFVRGPNGEDISYFVSKVVFTLHPSFAEATRGQSKGGNIDIVISLLHSIMANLQPNLAFWKAFELYIS